MNGFARLSFGAELTRPKTGDRRVFWQNKRLAIESKAGGNAGTVYAARARRLNFDIHSALYAAHGLHA